MDSFKVKAHVIVSGRFKEYIGGNTKIDAKKHDDGIRNIFDGIVEAISC